MLRFGGREPTIVPKHLGLVMNLLSIGRVSLPSHSAVASLFLNHVARVLRVCARRRAAHETARGT